MVVVVYCVLLVAEGAGEMGEGFLTTKRAEVDSEV